jgi:hypothetical protein
MFLAHEEDQFVISAVVCKIHYGISFVQISIRKNTGLGFPKEF